MATKSKQQPVLTQTQQVPQPWATQPVVQPDQKTPAQIAAENEQRLAEWYQVQSELDELKAKELRLRNECVAAYFGGVEKLKEGVNKRDMPEGWVLKATGKLNRKVDEAAIPAVAQELATKGVSIDTLVKYKPDLSTTVYRELTEEQRKIMDQALIITPGTPQLELAKPKR